MAVGVVGCIVGQDGLLGYLKDEGGKRKFTPFRLPSITRTRALAKKLTNRTGVPHIAVQNYALTAEAARADAAKGAEAEKEGKDS